ncbi:hypothetical protein EIP91_008785 [Steccherinum ochraceum]|uniref:High-affinity Zn(2+) transporter zrt1 n=1 Tax=Steccherinum ochraceum TaxID=92696 RepID=A0A4R0R4P7_9APHY|nr:hypothetical protein EIP91_008785 [Steccherinum ochraceum]
MSGFGTVLLMSALMGATSFGIGILPLALNFSKPLLTKLTTFGIGLLLGAALGVIIPEGIETLVLAEPSHFPKKTIALSLLMGFKFMLLVDRLIHRNDPDPTLTTSGSRPASAGGNGRVVFDVELNGLELSEGLPPEHDESMRNPNVTPPHLLVTTPEARKKAYPLTTGLVVHALSDGLALGSSALASDSPTASGLSLVVFLALIVHKAPTALALSTSLISTGLSASDCWSHLGVFSVATPISAVFSYLVMSGLGMNNDKSWTGAALLFSGGTFLFVATVLQPGKAATDELPSRMRFLLIILGMVVPTLLSSLVGDVH